VKKLFEGAIIKSWWVFLILSVSYTFYVHGMKKKEKDLAELQGKLKDLQKRKHIALAEQEDLIRQINSQSDPAWIQLVLMKGLGVVPEGQVKVFFTPYSEEK